MLGRILTTLGGLIGMLTVYLAMPAGFVVFGGNPLNAISVSASTSLMHDDGTLFLAGVTVFGWVTWTYFALGFLLAIFAQLSGRKIRLPGFGPAQALAALMLATITTTTAAPALSSARTVATVSQAQPRPAIAKTIIDQPSSSHEHETASEPSRPPSTDDNVAHQVQPRETLIDLAERYYGDPDATGRIIDANLGLVQPDGRSLQQGQVMIYSGWTLTIPAPTKHQAPTPAATYIATASRTETPVYQTQHDDYLWYIADRYLGDPERYPEIAACNPELIKDPDHIQPGWHLTLPADAHDRGERAHATGELLQPKPETPADESAIPPGQTDTDDGADLVSPQPTQAPVTTDPSATPTSGQGTKPLGQQNPSPTSTPSQNSDAEHRPAVHLALTSGGWITSGLMVALATAWFLVQRQRRRYRKPQFPIDLSHNTTVPEPSATIRAIAEAGIADSYEHQLHAPNEPWKPTTVTSFGIDVAGNELSLHRHLTGPTVLTGPANTHATRAIIAATLSSSIRQYGPECADLFIDTRTLARLLGLQQAHQMTRLIITQNPEETIEKLEREVLYRSRLLAQHDADDIDAINANPELDHLDLYVTVIPADPATDTRALAAAEQGRHMGITVIILGRTQSGPTAHIQTDGFGTSEPSAAQHSTLHGGRISLLTQEDLAAVLQMLLETEDTEQPDQDTEHADEQAKPAAAHGSANRQSCTAEQTEADPHILVPAQVIENTVTLNLLGSPSVYTATGETINLPRWNRSIPILAYLASHPYHDHSLEELADQIEPDSDPDNIKSILRTTITAIRKALRNSAGDDATYIRQEHRRYRLDPDTFNIDIWQMHAHLADANHAEDDDTALTALENAVACYKGDFATGFHQLWMAAKRTTYRNQITDALSRIAIIHETDRPEAALAALERARQIEEPHGINEPLAQTMMRIQGRLGRPDSVKRTMQTLRDHLREDGGRTPDPATERIYIRMISAERTAAQTNHLPPRPERVRA